MATMNDGQRFALRFGPYAPPLFKYGDVVMDEVRGEVKIVQLSAAKIPWPIGRRGSTVSLVVYAGLAQAIVRESNQAVSHWWGITPQVVSRWRKALEVPRANDGSKRLWEINSRDERVVQGFAKAQSKKHDPVRIAKSAATRRGRPRPPHVVAALRRASVGQIQSPESRRKHSATNKRKGIHPPLMGPIWTAEEDELVRTLTPREAARRTKRKLQAVYDRRHALSLPDGRRRENK